MRIEKIIAAKAESERFLAKVGELLSRMPPTPRGLIWFRKESSAVRRASMDLTRALAEMRRP